MKLKTLKPLYLGGRTLVEGTSFLTSDQHGRQLLQKGYAEPDDGKDEALVDLTDNQSEPAPMTSSSVGATQKPASKAKAANKKKAD